MDVEEAIKLLERRLNNVEKLLIMIAGVLECELSPAAAKDINRLLTELYGANESLGADFSVPKFDVVTQ